MTNAIIPTNNSDMQTFSPEQLKRAGELLGCKLDEASALRALIIQKDTGLSITRGEISIVPFAGKPTVMINKQGYLAYASRQPDYDGYESGIDEENGEMSAWCKVYSKTKSRPTSVRIYRSEFDKKQSIWNEKPRYMLEKTAISLALRAAYPVLNGTYSEEEINIQPVKIEPQETDIDVTPAKVEDVPKPKFTGAVYSMEQAQQILENMTSQGMDVSIFETAKVSASEFDKAAIDADFKRQVDARKQTKPTQAEPKKEADAVSYPFCADCGDRRVLPSEEKMSREKYGVPLCGACYKKRLEDAIRNNQDNKAAVQNLVTAAASDKPQNVCSVCGKPLSKAEVDAHNLFNKGKPMICRECASPKSKAAKTEAQANLTE